MAILKVSNELANQEWFKDLLERSFDVVEDITDIRTFRVQHPEIPKNDVAVCFKGIELEGIKPFIMEFEIYK